MRVLLFSHSSAVENLGGAERALLELIDAWVAADPTVEIFVITRTPVGLLQPELDARRVPWMMLPFTSMVIHSAPRDPAGIYGAARNDFAAVRAIERFLAEYRPDVVVTNTIVAPWAAIAARLRPTAHVWYVHEYGDAHEFRLPRDDYFTDIGLLSDLVLTSSESLRDFLAQWMPVERIAVAYPVVGLASRIERKPEDVPWPVSHGDGGADLRVVCVGRIMPSKGQVRLVRAVARLRDEGIRVEAAVIGSAEESYRRDVLDLVEQLGVGDRVAFTGELENPEGMIAQADVGVVASDTEGFGRVTVEYMLAGKAVVGSAVGATPELVDDGRTGRLFSLDDESALVDALRAYAQHPESVVAHGLAAARTARDDILRRHSVSAAIKQVSQIARSSPRQLDRLPAILESWFALPQAAIDLLFSTGAMVDPARSRTWRIGRAVLWAPRLVKRWVTGKGRDR